LWSAPRTAPQDFLWGMWGELPSPDPGSLHPLQVTVLSELHAKRLVWKQASSLLGTELIPHRSKAGMTVVKDCSTWGPGWAILVPPGWWRYSLRPLHTYFLSSVHFFQIPGTLAPGKGTSGSHFSQDVDIYCQVFLECDRKGGMSNKTKHF
jgi:hypothetical protein